MSYIVFSDESGRWSDPSCDLYVRSFVIFKEEDYYRLVGYLKHKKPSLHLKWSKNGDVRDNTNLCLRLFENSQIFIAFTDLSQFRAKDYRVKRAVSDLDYVAFLRDFQNSFDLKGELQNKVDQLLFLNVYERQFFERLIASVNANVNDFTFDELCLDNPQQNNDDFEKVINVACSPSPATITFVKNDSDVIGIGIADLVAGAFYDILLGYDRRKANDFYIHYIAPKNIPGDSSNPNPSYQFYPDGKKVYKSRMRAIWQRGGNKRVPVYRRSSVA